MTMLLYEFIINKANMQYPWNTNKPKTKGTLGDEEHFRCVVIKSLFTCIEKFYY